MDDELHAQLLDSKENIHEERSGGYGQSKESSQEGKENEDGNQRGFMSIMQDLKQSVGPYVLPTYEKTHYQDVPEDNIGGLSSSSYISPSDKLALYSSGVYIVAAVLMIIQGFGIILQGGWNSFFLGMYTMFFGCIVIAYDLQMDMGTLQLRTWFPFLGENWGKSSTIFFFALLAEQSNFPKWWNTWIMVFDIAVASLFALLHYTMNTTTSIKTTTTSSTFDRKMENKMSSTPEEDVI